MRITTKLFAALALALWCTSAQAAMTFFFIGKGNNVNTLSSNVFATNAADCPPQSVAVVAVAYNGTTATTSVTDSAGNTYSAPQDQFAGTGAGVQFYYSSNAADIPIGTTYTVNLPSAAASSASVWCMAGGATVNPLDKHNNTAAATAVTVSPSVSTGVLTQSVEAVLLIVGINAASGGTTCASGSGNTNGISAAGLSLGVCALVTASNASVTNTLSWGTAHNAAADIISFKGTPNAAPAPGRMTLLGVGP